MVVLFSPFWEESTSSWKALPLLPSQGQQWSAPSSGTVDPTHLASPSFSSLLSRSPAGCDTSLGLQWHRRGFVQLTAATSLFQRGCKAAALWKPRLDAVLSAMGHRRTLSSFLSTPESSWSFNRARHWNTLFFNPPRGPECNRKQKWKSLFQHLPHQWTRTK